MIQEDTQSKIEFFSNNIKRNISALYPYYEHYFFCFCELRSVIWENLSCLLLGLHQASICTTNHLLERMLKHSLFILHTKGFYIGNPEYDEKVDESKRLYDDKKLFETIKLACEKGIISQEESNDLNKWRKEIRNPYSHAESSKIIQNHPPLKGMLFDLNQVVEAKTKGIPMPMQNVEIPSFAIAPYIQSKIAPTISQDYFKRVFEIMVAIDERLKS